jgi:hypothetical protein
MEKLYVTTMRTHSKSAMMASTTVCARCLFPDSLRVKAKGFAIATLSNTIVPSLFEGLIYSCWVEDYNLYRTLREAWARRRNTPSTRYPAGWGRWRGEEYARSIAGEGPMFDTQGDRASNSAPANEGTGNIMIDFIQLNEERALREIASTLMNI